MRQSFFEIVKNQLRDFRFLESGKLVGTEYDGFWGNMEYPKGLSFRPSQRRDGGPNDVMNLRIGVSSVAQEPLRKIHISINRLDKYYSNHPFGYNEEDSDSPTLESINNRNRSRIPVEIISRDNFFLTQDGFIVDRAGDHVSLVDIVEKLKQKHFNTINNINFFMFWIKYDLINSERAVRIASLCERILLKIFGLSLQGKDGLAKMDGKFNYKDFKTDDSISVEFFGLKVRKREIFIFSFIVVFVHMLSVSLRAYCPFLIHVFSNTFLTLVYSVSIFCILFELIPRGLYLIAKWMYRIAWRGFWVNKSKKA